MRIAVCISGHPRFYEKGFEYFKKNLIDVNQSHQIDTFIHSWCSNLDEATAIDSLYKPKSCIFEPEKVVWSQNEHIHSNKIQYSMFYGMRMALTQSFHQGYDLIIRYRFDAALLKPVVINDVSEGLCVIDAINNPERYCDWMIFGKEKNMRHVADIYNELGILEFSPFFGEEALFAKIKKEQLSVHKLYPNQQGENLVLIRGQDDGIRGWINVKNL